MRTTTPSRGALALALAAATAAAAGCGGGATQGGGGAGAAGTAKRTEPVQLALDFTPNAVHAPLFAAVRTGADRRHGVAIHIRRPGAGPDSLKLVASGKIDLGVLDIQDLAIAQQHHVGVVAIGALVDRPLAALVARASIPRPAALAGRRVGVSGLPSDPAFVKAIVGHDGGDFGKVKQVTIGFNAVSSLAAGKVDAAPVFWNAEGVALRRHGVPIREFRIERYGAPAYPEVLLITSRRTLAHERGRLREALAAIRDGIAAVRRDPGAAVKEIAAAAETSDTGLVADQLRAVEPIFDGSLRMDRGVLERWAAFDARIGMVPRRPDVARAFDFTMAG